MNDAKLFAKKFPAEHDLLHALYKLQANLVFSHNTMKQADHPVGSDMDTQPLALLSVAAGIDWL